MAEIKIEKKSPVWPWILLILAIIGILIYLFASDDDQDDMREDTTGEYIEEPVSSGQEAMNNATVVDYVSFVDSDQENMDLSHEYTNEALAKLINATDAMASEVGYDVEADMQEVKQLAERITQEPFETTHANSIKEAATKLEGVLQNIQQDAFPNLSGSTDAVRNAAEGIDPEELTLNQKEDVKNFFRESAELLEQMNTNQPQI